MLVLSLNIPFYPQCHASKLMVSITLSSAFLYVDVMLLRRSLSHCVLFGLYKFVVLSTKMKALSDFLIFLMSSFRVFWNWPSMLRNFIFCTMSSRSSSNFSVSSISGELFLDFESIFILLFIIFFFFIIILVLTFIFLEEKGFLSHSFDDTPLSQLICSDTRFSMVLVYFS